MGFALATAARRRGHTVTLIAGPVALPAPDGVSIVSVISAEDMLDAVSSNLPECDALIMCAAVADWRPATISPRKLKKHGGIPTLTLEATPDILQTIKPRKRKRLFIGFAAETDDLEQEASRKLKSKGLDLIVANDVGRSDSGFEVENNRVVMIPASGPRRRLPLMSKDAVAERIMDWIDARWK